MLIRLTQTASRPVYTIHIVVLESLRCVGLCATPPTVAGQTLLSVGFSRQEDWSGLPFPSPEDLPHPGMEPPSPTLAGGFFTGKPCRLLA